MTKRNPQPQQAPVPVAPPAPLAHQHHHVAAAAGGDIEATRAAREVEVAMTVAKRFPRDVLAARERIMQACARPSLAEQATYAYQRGSTLVTGPSVRLAEAMAQSWGNMEFGIKELSQEDGKSSVQAFAWDMETNTRQIKNFVVPHLRYSKSDGLTRLTDPRDIYEMVANQGARRLRACILGIIPGDIQDEAVAQCETTLKNAGGPPAEQMKKLVETFAGIGVSSDLLAHKIGHSLSSITMAEVIRLRQTFGAIRDGMTSVSEQFPASTPAEPAADKPKTARGAAAAAAEAARTTTPPAATDAPRTLQQFEDAVRAVQPGSDLQAVLDDARTKLSEPDHMLLKRFAERMHGGGE